MVEEVVEEKLPRKKQEAVRSANPMASKPKEKPAEPKDIKKPEMPVQK
jgi:hypothetical protein